MIRKLQGVLVAAVLCGGVLNAQAPARTPVVIGPPAPVPPEVAMLRPTLAELEQVNDAVRKLIETDQSPSKPLL